MKPDFFDDFRCIASACKHTCCAGWEIDVDADTADYYASLSGEDGTFVRARLDYGEDGMLLCREGERCRFLREDNLCELILRLGEDALCDICASHPRFHNEFEDHTEIGLGLCCEAAGCLILGQAHPVKFNGLPHSHSSIQAIQNRQRPIDERLPSLPDRSWSQILRSLERMDRSWDGMLDLLDAPQSPDFDRHMKDRQAEYEQLAVYLQYRHNNLAFTSFGYHLIHQIGAAFFHKYGHFTFEDQVEVCRLFSCEIEYSEENLETIFELL
jgi:lysine-N-methylase